MEKPDSQQRKQARPKAKKWLLNGAALLVPLFFFLTLEGGLRLFGYGEDYPLFIEAPIDANFLYQNPQVARRYFKKQQNAPSSQRDFFKAIKDSTTFRIFVQGGSSAAGYPLYYGGSFSRMLEQRLLQSFPGRNIEVINTAMAAVNSYTLLDLADEIIEHAPDLVLIYAGHNEFYGSLGIGSSESFGNARPIVNAYLRIQHWRIVQVLQALLQQGAQYIAEGDAATIPGATLMSRMVQEQEIPFGSSIYRQGIAQFEGNMGDLLAKYAANSIPVLIGTIASNERDQPPFISRPATSAQKDPWAESRAGVRLLLDRGDTAGALAVVEDVIGRDSIAASAFFGKGQVLERLGRYDAARLAYIQAKDRDQLRFRAPEAINERIRRLADAHGALVVDAQEALRKASQNGIIGKEVMLEHLHPNVEGYFAIADAFYEAMRAARLIGNWDVVVPARSARSEVLFTKVDSLVGQYRLEQLMNSWPFQPMGTVGEKVEKRAPTSRINDIAYALYSQEMSWYQATEALKTYYDAEGDLHNALKAGLAIIQEFPYIAPPYLMVSTTLAQQGRLEEAMVYALAANDREESVFSLNMAGAILLQKQQHAEAIGYFEKVLALDVANEQALQNLANASFALENYDLTKATVAKLLAVNPSSGVARQMEAYLRRLP